MSVTSIPNKPQTTAWRPLLIATMAVVVLSLQVGLPWLSCYLAHDPQHAERMFQGLSDERSFWCLRFSFDRFLQPSPSDSGYTGELLSATVCRDEIVFLANSYKPLSMYERINLRTGRVTSSPLPNDMLGVVSDGQTLLWSREPTGWGRVVLQEGRPVQFHWKDDGNTNPERFAYEMMELDEGRWRSTRRFVLFPKTILKVRFITDIATGKLCCFAYSGFDDRLWFQYDLKVYSEEELELALARDLETEAMENEDYGDSLIAMGWESLPSTEWVPPWDLSWVEQRIVSKVGINHYPSIEGPQYRVWTRFFEDGRVEHQSVTVPIRRRTAGTAGDDLILHPVTSADGTIYFIHRNQFDDRWTVLRWNNGRLDKVVEQYSPYLGITCLDAALFAMFALIVPMTVLWWTSRFIQTTFPLSNRVSDKIKLASIGRRGLARAIDVTVWGLPLLLAFVFHPEVVEWWGDDLLGPDRLWNQFKTEVQWVLGNLSWQGILDLRRSMFEKIQACFPLPMVRPLAIVSLVIFMGQTAWQCASGQTFGKWLLGIKVVRSDLRRCSWGRSCLREALFFVDTLLLLSWVHGVVSILLTSKSQRIGDWVTDTIVVRLRSQK